jgi:hypothetical protein
MSKSVWQMMITDSNLPARQRLLLLVVHLYAEDHGWPRNRRGRPRSRSPPT